MDVVATALTVAWLDAVRRTQSEVPLAKQGPGPAESLGDVIENALRSGGQDSLEPGWVDPARPDAVPPDPLRPGQVIDLSV
jgi:hypothetical protein